MEQLSIEQLQNIIYPKEFDVKHTGLANLSLDAATSLDFLSRGLASADCAPIKILSHQIKKFIFLPEIKKDTSAIVLLGKIMNQYSDRQIRTTEDLYMKLSLLTREMENPERLTREKSLLLSKVCLDISKFALNYYQETHCSYLAA